MILSDSQIITHVAEQYMINPFVPQLVKSIAGKKIMSFGLSSFGYDIRLSNKEFYVFRHVPGQVVDPKNFCVSNLEAAPLYESELGCYFIIPGNSYGLGVAVEELQVPRDVTAICVGKSSYARCGVIVNVTPAEAGWRGYLTLEFSNSSSTDVKVYVNEGCAQLLFLKASEECLVSYEDRAGKYQRQSQNVQPAKV